MKRPPFKLLGSRHAQSRRPGGRIIDGRSTFVWLHGVLIPLAIGYDGPIQIRRRSPDGPWHTITYTPDEALALIEEHYPLQRASLIRVIMTHRWRLETRRQNG